MANTYYDSQLTGAQIEHVLEVINGLITPSNNGKVLAINSSGKLEARSVQWGERETLISKNISANGDYDPADDGADGYSAVHVAVPNTYAAADEGKVVSSGALVAQTARVSEITNNGTYDTTYHNQVTVNISGGGEDPNDVFYLIDPKLLDLYDLTQTSVYTDTRKIFLIPGMTFGSQNSNVAHAARVLRTLVGEEYKNCLTRDGWYHTSTVFWNIIPPGKYTKLRMFCTCGSAGGSDTYWYLYIYKAAPNKTGQSFFQAYPYPGGSSISIDSNSDLLRTVTLSKKGMSVDDINNQSGVTIHQTSSGMAWQEVIIDISSYTDPLMIAFRDCDCVYSVYYLKATRV